MAQYLLLLHDLDESPELVASARDLAASDAGAEFVLLVPAVMFGAMDALLLPYSNSRQLARARAQRVRSQLVAAGLHLVATRLGNSSPLQALADALRFADYAAVVIASPPHPLMHRLHRDLPCRAGAKFPRTRVIHAAGGRSRSLRSRALGSDSLPSTGA